MVQNSHFFIPPFSEILYHSQSFIPHFLNSRLHYFRCIFLPFKEIWHSLCKATLRNEANRKWKKYTFSFPRSILIIFFSFELSGPLDFTIVEPPKKLLMSVVLTFYLKPLNSSCMHWRSMGSIICKFVN